MSLHDLQITWLTQGGFLLEQEAFRLVVDPYMSDAAERQLGWTRLTPPPLSLDELRPDMVLCTHDHLDHLDPVGLPALLAQYPECGLLGPGSVARLAGELGIEAARIRRIEPGQSLELGPFKVTAVVASHSDPDAVGFLISTPKRRVYVSGDSRYWPEMAWAVSSLCPGRLDLALVCINGRMNNMTWLEAQRLVSQLNPRLAAPMHYGLFKENTVDPQPFIKRCREAGNKCMVMEPGKAFSLAQAIEGNQA